ncbi:MAG: hypothetical protein E7J02_13545, partial [Staphylococcus warneri]|nr:hypothetical protein [Staphylococcus warneri]
FFCCLLSLSYSSLNKVLKSNVVIVLPHLTISTSFVLIIPHLKAFSHIVLNADLSILKSIR